MPYKIITYDREKLYEEVWLEPMRKLAPKYGISDVALSKICKKLNIPKPGPGYWTKVEMGKPVGERPQLPPAPEGLDQLITERWPEKE